VPIHLEDNTCQFFWQLWRLRDGGTESYSGETRPSKTLVSYSVFAQPCIDSLMSNTYHIINVTRQTGKFYRILSLSNIHVGEHRRSVAAKFRTVWDDQTTSETLAACVPGTWTTGRNRGSSWYRRSTCQFQTVMVLAAGKRGIELHQVGTRILQRGWEVGFRMPNWPSLSVVEELS
jgi:hypothetical protein